jgi:hypothetical protein
MSVVIRSPKNLVIGNVESMAEPELIIPYLELNKSGVKTCLDV